MGTLSHEELGGMIEVGLGMFYDVRKMRLSAANCVCVSAFWGCRPQILTGALSLNSAGGFRHGVPQIPYALPPNSGYATVHLRKGLNCLHAGCYNAIKSQNTVKPNPLCQLPVTSATSRDVPFSPDSIMPTSPKLPVQGSFGEVGVMEFGLKGTSRLGRHGKSA